MQNTADEPTDKYSMKVTALEEFGILDRSCSVFTDSGLMETSPHRPAATGIPIFARARGSAVMSYDIDAQAKTGGARVGSVCGYPGLVLSSGRDPAAESCFDGGRP